MILKSELYCPTLKRKLEIKVSIPKGYNESNLKFDCLYMLDGQNIYKDYEAAFGRSLRMGKYLAIMATKFNKRICGVAISNAQSDQGRIDEYTPFKLEKYSLDSWKKLQNLDTCKAFTYDFIHTIIPYIKKNYPVSDNSFILGSSLGALYASYISHTYPSYFNGAGIFSICTFLCDNGFYKHLETNINKNIRSFVYVGLEETSDDIYDKTLYYEAALKYYNFLKDHNLKTRLHIDPTGYHNEETWEKHILEFLAYMYYDDISISN